MKKTLKKFYGLAAVLYLFCFECFAAKSSGFGEIAQNIHEPLGHLAQLIRLICLVAGSGLVIGAIVRFRQYRKNPVQTPLSGVIALLLAGLAVLSLVLIPIPGVK